MNDDVREWIAKGEGDFSVATRESIVAEGANFDAVCYHCQQCIEKLLKGALIGRGVNPPHVHDLAYLSKLLRQAGAEWNADERELYFLSESAVVFRYPGETASEKDAKEAIAICERLRADLHRLLSAQGG